MGVVTFTEEFTSPISAQRLFKALILDGDNLIPKIITQAIKSVEIIGGDGGPGSIKEMNFAEGISVKHRIGTLDKENMSYAYTVIEGDALTDRIESISYEVKLDTSPDGGCIGKNISKYHTCRPDVEITEELIKDSKEKAAAVFKAVEAYLVLGKP